MSDISSHCTGVLLAWLKKYTNKVYIYINRAQGENASFTCKFDVSRLKKGQLQQTD